MTAATAVNDVGPTNGATSRPSTRDSLKHDGDDDDDTSNDVDDSAHNASSKPKKKRRIIKTPDKKYQCPAEDCGKAYSRAEHLYRHQLNHTPKQIYRCDFPGCDRHFVRADLCARHKERHTAKGSHLQRKDAFMHSQRAAAAAAVAVHTNGNVNGNVHASAKPNAGGTFNGVTIPSPDVAESDASPARMHQTHSTTSISDSYTSETRSRRLSTTEGQQSYRGQAVPSMSTVSAEAGLHMDTQMDGGRPNSYGMYSNNQRPNTTLAASPNENRYGYDHVYDRHMNGVTHNPVLAINSMNGTLASPPPPPPTGYSNQQMQFSSPTLSSVRSPTDYPGLQPVSTYPMTHNYGPTSDPSMLAQEQQIFQTDIVNPQGFEASMDPTAYNYAMPVFGAEGFSRSPSVIMDDNFLNLFFSMNGSFEPIHPSPPAVDVPQEAKFSLSHALAKREEFEERSGEDEKIERGSDGEGTTLDTLDINTRESVITGEKQQRLMSLVGGWPRIEHNANRRDKAEILDGDVDQPTHVMSTHMLKTYIASFWTNIHCQMPILHRPTFNAETCPDLLILAMACLGATCLERTHSPAQTRDSAELAFFIAYHIRWEVFKDAEFRPTAKLWTFQTMLLLELFEKMYSTRALHERAHIHHATTLTVMRRGSSLIGRNATEVPHKSGDPTRTPPGPENTINTSGQNTHDAFWNRWITAEATRRVAFAAFIIDSTHATLFGHSAAMSPHDLRLALPCDEALWSATSSAEVQRVEASLAANGFKPSTFLDGLKKTLNGQKVRTNTFGRVVLMSGLLNISWHMNQRDLQISSLGAANTLGNHVRWRSPLTRAFDFWRRDFDESLAKSDHWLQVCNHKPNDREGAGHRDHVFESRTCLHSLAHMAMHVDINDCLVFAGADHVLGRAITESDRTTVQRRMREQWAPSARARDATFYALRFLSEVLIPEEDLSVKRETGLQAPVFRYSARDDYLLNRPWVLYFALLIVWSYGYALDGALGSSTHSLSTRHLRIVDMQQFLIRMGGVASPDDLGKLGERNACLGLLLLLRESFGEPRWELLQDANTVLGSCIDLLLSKTTNGDSDRNRPDNRAS